LADSIEKSLIINGDSLLDVNLAHTILEEFVLMNKWMGEFLFCASEGRMRSF
jgi:hypothetical protein